MLQDDNVGVSGYARLPGEIPNHRWWVNSKALTLIEENALTEKKSTMKITAKTITPKAPAKTYPYFGKFSTGLVVLFFEPETGISVDKIPGVFKKDWNETSVKVLEHFEATFSV